MKLVEDIAKEYSYTWAGTDNINYVDLGEKSNEEDFFKFLIELAEKKEIDAIEKYKNEAEEDLLGEYDKENITGNMIIAKTYILQMVKERLWNLYEDEIKKVLNG